MNQYIKKRIDSVFRKCYYLFVDEIHLDFCNSADNFWWRVGQHTSTDLMLQAHRETLQAG